jgi:DNA adenine methylase
MDGAANKKYVSPLRYPGGKLKVVDYVKRLYEANDLVGGTYVEPYAGGASVALSLLFSNYAQIIRINDIDRSIYAFWHSVLNETETLCQMIKDKDVNMDEWYRQHDIQNHKNDVDDLTLGFSTFFLNRTNRSGILSAGVIGGKDQTGKYKLDARYNKENLINRIYSIASYADRIVLTNMDAVTLLKTIEIPAEKTLCYLDPPYYVKGPDLYLNYYCDEDHRLIAQAVRDFGGLWLISYDAAPFIRNLYQCYRQTEYYLSYSAGNPAKGKEIMVYSDNLVLPEGEVVKIKKTTKR